VVGAVVVYAVCEGFPADDGAKVSVGFAVSVYMEGNVSGMALVRDRTAYMAAWIWSVLDKL
jgi:hypothetical protein